MGELPVLNSGDITYQQKRIGRRPDLIKFVTTPSFELQKFVIQECGGRFYNQINNRDPFLATWMLTAVNGTYIKYIHAPSRREVELAISQTGYAILEVGSEWLDDDLWLLAISNSGELIEHYVHPSKELQEAAIASCPWAMKHIENPVDGLNEKLIDMDPAYIVHISDPSIELQRIAVSYEPGFVKYIDNPPEEILILALEQDASLLHYYDKETWTHGMIVAASQGILAES